MPVNTIFNPVIFHNIALNSRNLGVGMRAYTGCLKPERGVPAVALGKAASDLIIAVFMHKLRGILLAERPEVARGFVAGIVERKSARLQMRGAEIVTLAKKIDLERSLADLNSLCGKGG